MFMCHEELMPTGIIPSHSQKSATIKLISNISYIIHHVLSEIQMRPVVRGARNGGVYGERHNVDSSVEAYRLP